MRIRGCAIAGSRPISESLSPPPIPDAIRARDPLALQWWVIQQVIEGTIQPNQASAIATVVRTLANLPPAAADEAEALAAIALRGQLMHGIPPRSAAQWELAARLFDDDALAEFRRWSLLEDDGADVREEFGVRDLIAHEREVAAVVHDEDRV